MLYPFISFPNGTEIVHSEIYYENDIPVVRVEIEEPDNKSGHFKSMQIILPMGTVRNISGFSKDEVDYHKNKMIGLKDVIFECAKDNMKQVC